MRHSLCLGHLGRLLRREDSWGGEFWQIGEKGKVFGKGRGGCRGAFQSRELVAMDQAEYP